MCAGRYWWMQAVVNPIEDVVPERAAAGPRATRSFLAGGTYRRRVYSGLLLFYSLRMKYIVQPSSTNGK